MANNRKRAAARASRQHTAPRKSSWITRKVDEPSPRQLERTLAQLRQAQLAQLAQTQRHPLLHDAGEYRTSWRGRVVSASLQQGPVLPALPQLGPDGQLVHVASAPVAVKRPGDDLAHAVKAVRAGAWRHRWQLTPAAATVGTALGAGVAPVPTLFGLGVTAAAAFVAATKGPDEIHGRTWLSRIEREVVGRWAVGATVWTAGIATANGLDVPWTGATVLVAAGAYGSLAGWPVVEWLQSRRVRKDTPEKLSEAALAMIAAWPATIGSAHTGGPQCLHGSRILADTMREPAPGTMAFTVELAASVHAGDAVGDDVRKHLERVLQMGIDTVRLEANRDNAGQLLVTLTPSRHLEKVAAEWLGPILRDDGSIPLAVTPDGGDVDVALHGLSGIEHFGVFGASDTGKSFTVTAMVLPGVVEQRDIIVYVDGGEGSSCGHLAGACDWWAVRGPDEWAAAIETVHRVLKARKDRRGKQLIDKWRGKAETLPIITLLIDEAPTVVRALPARFAAMVLEMLREGRKHGVRVGQVAQDPMSDEILGGRKARGQMGGAGSLIGHRPGDPTAAMLTAGSTSAKIDLRDLPPTPGWCGIIRRGQVLAKACRVRYAEPDKVREVLASITPLALTGDDLAAAGPAYAARRRGPDVVKAAAAAERGEPVETPAPVVSAPALTLVDAKGPDAPGLPTEGIGAIKAAAGQLTRQKILTLLGRAGEAGLTRDELAKAAGVTAKTVNKHLAALRAAGHEIEKGDDDRLRRVVESAAA